MREILFRGKDPETGTWHEGFYMALSDTTYCFKEDYDANPDNTKHYIVFDRMTDWCLPNQHILADIDPSTVGQYTGLTDKNGKRIFEGDILESHYDDEFPDDTTIEAIEWFNNGWCAHDVEHMTYEAYGLYQDNVLSLSEVIGNIHDNPELLKMDGGVT